MLKLTDNPEKEEITCPYTPASHMAEQKPTAAATVLRMHKLPLLSRDPQAGSNSCLGRTGSAHGPPHLHSPYQGANGQHTEERGSKHPN